MFWLNLTKFVSNFRGIVLVSFSRSPSFTDELLKNTGIDIEKSNEWLRVLDCYTDPLGWKERLKPRNGEASPNVNLCKDVKNLDHLFSLILALGKGIMRGINSEICWTLYTVVLMILMCLHNRTCWGWEKSVFSCHRLGNTAFFLFSNSKTQHSVCV